MAKFYLNCFILDDESCCPFPAKTSPDKMILELIQDVKKAYDAQIKSSSIVVLELYQVDASSEEEDLVNMQMPSREDKLKLIKRVRDYWKNPGDICEDRIQILVKAEITQWPVFSSTVRATENQFNSPTEEDQHRKLIERFKQSRILYCQALIRYSASATARHDEFLRQQWGKYHILNGRPRQHTGPPIVLYHPVFGNFLSNLQSSDSLDPEFEKQIFEYFWASQQIYAVEERKSQVKGGDDANPRDALKEFLGQLWKLSEESAALDTAAIHVGGHCIILEMTNEIGTGGSDPSVQAAQSYSRLWQSSNLFDRCCCPSILIAIAGPWMCILGAVFLDRPIVQPLTDYLWIGINPSKPRGIHSVARAFHCVLEARKELQTYYDNLSSKDLKSLPVQPLIFPYPNHFITDNGERVDFAYIIPLELRSLEMALHLERSRSQLIADQFVFVAALCNTNPPLRIVIKFVESYNADAHKLLAQEGLAPELLYDGTVHANRQLGPHHYMVVMEYIDGVDLGRYVGPALPLCVTANLDHALSVLHNADIVFGDLRPPNVMLVKDTNGVIIGAKLIDFDWCAKHGVGRYPLSMNQSIAWADGVQPGGLMFKEHDDEMKSLLPV
ncbi:kinase domain protein [Rhizoctonia solani 123E]|uniref:Kinase domain protein n=1 Tax=Rhizoctonia solani 123E TaxID=1423351 RepID=A0A074RNB1_9AGAM|nr:kinase domain protein [Rhizoctonia solani 123E]